MKLYKHYNKAKRYCVLKTTRRDSFQNTIYYITVIDIQKQEITEARLTELMFSYIWSPIKDPTHPDVKTVKLMLL